MWLTYSKAHNTCQSSGFIERRFEERSLFYSNDEVPLQRIGELRDAEYQQAVEIDPIHRRVTFGRDYLGHFPLFYAHSKDAIFISDDVREIARWLRENTQSLTISNLSIALYFSMGYIPQGFTAFNEIHSCRNATLYQWKDGKITEEDLFRPIAVASDCGLADIDQAINAEIEIALDRQPDAQVWCSGGLDSSIVSTLCNRNGHKTDLLALEHIGDFKNGFGDGELPYTIELQKQLRATLLKVSYSPESFSRAYGDFLDLHPTPVIDPVVTPKYLLAKDTRTLALTGEGGDPIFGGVKNNIVHYMHEQSPDLNVGEIYGLAHQRFHSHLGQLLVRGQELRTAVNQYLQSIWESYPGSVARKLFYINTFEKQGGMIFPKNYYAAKYGRARVRHPLTSLRVYETAFALADDLKYRYPDGKLVLLRLYGQQLPPSITNRKKSGTLVPVGTFLKYIPTGEKALNSLRDSELIDHGVLGKFAEEDIARLDHTNALLAYALFSLNKWLNLLARHSRPALGAGKA